MWSELVGTPKRWSATAGTFTGVSGTRILQIGFVGGTLVLPTGDGTTTQTITGVASQWFWLQENHVNFILGTGGGTGAQLQLVFGSTTSAFVEYLNPPGAS